MKMNEENDVYLTIENEQALVKFVKGAVRDGYLRKLDLRDVATWITTANYPIKVPVDLDAVLTLGKNFLIKGTYGKTIDAFLTDYLKGEMGIE